MRTQVLDAALTALARSHRGGHRCSDDDGQWHNDQTGTRQPCPALVLLTTAQDHVAVLREAVHTAAHDHAITTRVAEGMTGLVLADLPDEEREGWRHTAAMAIETLSAELDRDPTREARAAALQQRLADRLNPTRQETPS